MKLVESALTLSPKASPPVLPRKLSTMYTLHAVSGRAVGPLSSDICFSFRISSLSFCSSVNVFFLAALGFLAAAFFLTAFLAGFLALGLAAFLAVDFLVVEELFGFVVFLVVDLEALVAFAAGERIDADKLMVRTEGAARRKTSARAARPEN